ncbi:MAG: HupU protein, partial [Alphaproteobacteria bacterium]
MRERPLSVLWLQSGGCGGCTMSLLCAESPDLMALFETAGIRLLWHPSLSEESGAEALDLFERILAGAVPLDVLCVEGSLLRGPNGTAPARMRSNRSN